MPDLNAMYVRWLTDLWEGHLDDLLPLAESLVTDDFVGTWPGRPGLVRGPAALVDVVRQGRLPFSDLRFSLEVGPVTADDLVAARWVARGLYAGGEHALPGVSAPAGTPVEFRGHDIVRAQGDRFCEYWVISEEGVLAEQLRGG